MASGPGRIGSGETRADRTRTLAGRTRTLADRGRTLADRALTLADRTRGRLRIRIWASCATAAALVLGGMLTATSASAQQRQAAAPAAHPRVAGHLHAVPGHHDYAAVCAAAKAHHFACLALVRTNVKTHLQPAARADAGPVGDGYGPSNLQSAYNLPSSTAGSGQTVAVVDAFDDPSAASDLATYRSA